MTNKSATVKEQVEQFFLWYRGYRQRSLGLVLLYHSVVFISFIVLLNFIRHMLGLQSVVQNQWPLDLRVWGCYDA